MNNKRNNLLEYRRHLMSLSEEEKILHDLHLRRIALGEVYGPLTGYASLDKIWLKYYREEYIKNPIPHMTAAEYIEKQNENNRDGIAFEAPDGVLTYGEFIDTYHKAACSLAECGIQKGDKIATMLTPMALESIMLYAGNLIGAADSGIPEFSTPAEVCRKINKLGIRILYITDDLLTEEMENAIYQNTKIDHIVYFNFGHDKKHNPKTLSWNEFLGIGEGKELPDNHVTPEDTVYIAETGGSTGEAKSVMLDSNGFNIAAHQYLNSDLDYKSGDKWIRLWSLFSASACVSNNHLPLAAGMRNILRNFPYQNIEQFVDITLETQPNHFMIIPQLLDVLERSEKIKDADLASFIKTVGCGGLAITSEFEAKVANFLTLYNILTFLGYGWGCTENSTSAAMRSNFDTTKVGFVGAPLVKTVVAVFDPETGEELPYGEEGELCINSYTIMQGYFNDEELTNEVVKIHDDGSKWIHTGDLGIIDMDGLVKVHGRMTRTIFTLSEKLYPTAMENTLSKVPGVREISICKMADPENEGFSVPICYFVPEDNFTMEIVQQNLEQACIHLYEPLSRPRAFYGRPQLPLNKVGKIDVLALEKELEQSNKENVSRNRVKKS